MARRRRISTKTRRQLEFDAAHRCSYCRSPMAVGIPMLADHIIPLAAGGGSAIDNLCLCCYRCNEFKNDSTTALDPVTAQTTNLYHPRKQRWNDHFAWSVSGLIISGQTPAGRCTIELLRLNDEFLTRARRLWMLAGIHPPVE